MSSDEIICGLYSSVSANSSAEFFAFESKKVKLKDALSFLENLYLVMVSTP